MNTGLLKARQTKYAAYAAVYVLVVLTGGIKKDEDAYRLVADLSRIIAS